MTRKCISVVYRPEISVATNSFSPSSDKPRHVDAHWLEHGLPIKLVQAEPLTPDILQRTHSPAYIDKQRRGHARDELIVNVLAHGGM